MSAWNQNGRRQRCVWLFIQGGVGMGRMCCHDPKESHLLRRLTQDNSNSLCLLWRNCLFNKRKILTGLFEILWWSLSAVERSALCIVLPRVSRRRFHFNIPGEVISALLLSRFLHSFLNTWFAIGNWIVFKEILGSKRKPPQQYF